MQLKLNTKNTSTPSRLKSSHPSRGEFNTWHPKSLYPYWEIPKSKALTDRAKELRKAGNLAEVIFWKTFNNKKKLSFDIDRQVVVGNFIVDFFIPELGLVFEIDGSSHDDKVEYDIERDAFMEDFKIRVIRIKDIEIKKNIGKVYELVLDTVEKRIEELKFPS